MSRTSTFLIATVMMIGSGIALDSPSATAAGSKAVHKATYTSCARTLSSVGQDLNAGFTAVFGAGVQLGPPNISKFFTEGVCATSISPAY